MKKSGTTSRKKPTAAPSVLIVGYGSALRCDDAAGLHVVKHVARWKRPGVRALPRHQLTPELAEDLAACDVVIFVDAYAATANEPVRVEHMQPRPLSARSTLCFAHMGNPRTLLDLTEATYDHRPDAWLIGIPASRFDLGQSISAPALRHIEQALKHIEQLLDRLTAEAKAKEANHA